MVGKVSGCWHRLNTGKIPAGYFLAENRERTENFPVFCAARLPRGWSPAVETHFGLERSTHLKDARAGQLSSFICPDKAFNIPVFQNDLQVTFKSSTI